MPGHFHLITITYLCTLIDESVIGRRTTFESNSLQRETVNDRWTSQVVIRSYSEDNRLPSISLLEQRLHLHQRL